MKCKKCGTWNADTAKFCRSCGCSLMTGSDNSHDYTNLHDSSTGSMSDNISALCGIGGFVTFVLLISDVIDIYIAGAIVAGLTGIYKLLT